MYASLDRVAGAAVRPVKRLKIFNSLSVSGRPNRAEKKTSQFLNERLRNLPFDQPPNRCSSFSAWRIAA